MNNKKKTKTVYICVFDYCIGGIYLYKEEFREDYTFKDIEQYLVTEKDYRLKDISYSYSETPFSLTDTIENLNSYDNIIAYMSDDWVRMFGCSDSQLMYIDDILNVSGLTYIIPNKNVKIIRNY